MPGYFYASRRIAPQGPIEFGHRFIVEILRSIVMRIILITLVATGLLLGSGGYSIAYADDDDRAIAQLKKKG